GDRRPRPSALVPSPTLFRSGKLASDVSGALAEFARVLPDGARLRAKRNAVERGVVGVLAGHRHGTGEALGCQRRNRAAGRAVVRSAEPPSELQSRENLVCSL